MPVVNRPHNNCIHKEESDPTQFPSESRLARPIAGRNHQQECPCRHGRVGSKNVHVAMAVWAPRMSMSPWPCGLQAVHINKNVHVAMAVWAPRMSMSPWPCGLQAVHINKNVHVAMAVWAPRMSMSPWPCGLQAVHINKNVHVAMAVWAPRMSMSPWPCGLQAVHINKNVHVAMAVWAPSCPHLTSARYAVGLFPDMCTCLLFYLCDFYLFYFILFETHRSVSQDNIRKCTFLFVQVAFGTATRCGLTAVSPILSSDPINSGSKHRTRQYRGTSVYGHLSSKITLAQFPITSYTTVQRNLSLWSPQ